MCLLCTLRGRERGGAAAAVNIHKSESDMMGQAVYFLAVKSSANKIINCCSTLKQMAQTPLATPFASRHTGTSWDGGGPFAGHKT